MNQLQTLGKKVMFGLGGSGRHAVSRPARMTSDDNGLDSFPSSRGFAALLSAFSASGGTARSDELASLLEGHKHGDRAGLARLMGSGDIFSFEWHDTAWVPMFQFEPLDLSIKPGPSRIFSDMKSVFDGWSMAAWFAQPNSWLHGRRPVDLLDSDCSAVSAAARIDRFIAVG